MQEFKQFKDGSNRENKLLVEYLNVSKKQVNRLAEKLKVTRKQLQICEEESTNYLQSFHDVSRRAAESDRQLQFRSDENKRFREEIESLLKYKQNYRDRNVNCTWITEVLDELERVTTHFSFRRRSSTKRALINRLRDLFDRTMKMRCTQQDNAGNQGLQLRR